MTIAAFTVEHARKHLGESAEWDLVQEVIALRKIAPVRKDAQGSRS